MTPREIIAQAWAITKKEGALRRWGFTTSFFETLLNVKLLGYQAYIIYGIVAGVHVGMFDDFIWLHERVPFWFFVVVCVFFVLLVILEFLIPHLCKGAIIGLAAKSYRGEKVEGGTVLALYNFFPLFAIHEIFVLSGWATALSAVSLILRYVDGSVKYAAIIAVALIFCVSNLLKLFAGFAEESVVLRKSSIGGGIAHSYKLLISHLSHIMFVLLLLFVISLRIVLNAFTILLIPGVIFGLGFLLAIFLTPAISYLIAGLVGIGLIFGASYFFAYLEVFKQTVWTLTYIELSSRKELDVIDL